MVSFERLERSDWLTLTDGEEIEWTGRPSLFTIVPELLVAAVVFVGGGLVVSLFEMLLEGMPTLAYALPIALGSALAGLTLLRWFRIRYVITTETIYIKRGLVSLDVSQIRLSRIQNTTLEQSVLERLLSYGDVVAYTAGTDTMDIELRDVPNPANVNRILTRLLSEPENEPVRI